MKTMRNALNITADNHELVKAGYIQLPVPITITEEWLNSPSLLYKEETNRERLMYDLRACGITDTDFENLIGKTIYSVPDDAIYNAYLEVTRLDKLTEQEDIAYEDMQKYLSESDAYVEQMTEAYSRFSELLIDRVWNYYLFKEQVKLDRLMHAYKEMVAECTVQTLLFILVNTPNFAALRRINIEGTLIRAPGNHNRLGALRIKTDCKQKQLVSFTPGEALYK